MDEEMSERSLHWNHALERIIASEGEKCRGLAWLHQKSESLLSGRNNYIALPVIVLSTLAGTASVGSSSLFGSENTGISNIAIGLVSIGVGILNTLNSYFNFARRSEAHHIAYIHYSKLFSWIEVELALPRDERASPQEMLKSLRDSMNRLSETAPTIPASIINQFKHEFKNYTDVTKPVETNGLSKIIVYGSASKYPALQSASHTMPSPLLALRSSEVSQTSYETTGNQPPALPPSFPPSSA